MTDEMRPALTETEWRLAKLWRAGKLPGGKIRGMVILDLPEDHQYAAMALANLQLDDSDPHKITREDVNLVREAAAFARWWNAADLVNTSRDLDSLAAKLQSLLPLEEPKT